MQDKNNPQVAHAIIAGLTKWHQHSSYHSPNENFPKLNTAIHQQNLLGWQHFLEGWVSTQWADSQHIYFQWIGKQNTGRHWIVSLIAKLWQVAWDQWEHRNATLHKLDLVPSIEASELLNEEVKIEYSFGIGLLLTKDHYVLGVSLSHLLAQSFEQRKLWLTRIQEARAARHRLNQSTLRHLRVLMQSWLSQSCRQKIKTNQIQWRDNPFLLFLT
mmetsp:Transcript_11672/g.17824  ORF Transcript_11672/g.17824 Transcript_11672/m.17824 type:complete len:215 (+) Transcript_11672:1101-1745(+)